MAITERQGKNRRTLVAFLAVAIFTLMALLPYICWRGFAALRGVADAITQEPQFTLRLAYSPEKRALIEEVLASLEAQDARTAGGQPVLIQALEMLPENMVKAAVAGEVDAVCPDSSFWLTAIDQEWQQETLQASTLVGEVVRFAVSPVVIAMKEDVALSMGYPASSIGWQDILSRAQSDSEFSWSHSSTSTASGLLATLAEFYAGAGKTRGLTIEDVTNENTLAYVAAVEATVRHYGEGELATIERALKQGSLDVDAVVVQEQLVIYYNNRSQERLVAIYPAEGTLWEDHPLAIIERPDLSADARDSFRILKEYLLGVEAQKVILQHGYRPADLSIALDGPESPISPANGVDPSKPQTVLQMPSAPVVEVVREVWWYTKRHTNVYLVVDTSGSMEGVKIAKAQAALVAFLEAIRGDEERVGLVEFASGVERIIPLNSLGDNRLALESAVQDLTVGGNTALLDGISTAYSQLQNLRDTERINAIVVMTDGRENASKIVLRQLLDRIHDGSQRGVPVYIFCVAYGSDADMGILRQIAEASGGQVREGDLTSIEDLYKLISTYF